MEKPKKRTFHKIFLGGILALFALCLILFGAFALINRSMPQHLAVEDHLTPADKARIAESIHLRSVFGDQIMPGFSSAGIPIIVYNEKYAFLIGLENPEKGWLKIPQRTQKGTAWEPVPDEDYFGQPYFRQRLADSKTTPQAFTVLVGDRWSASLGVFDWMKIVMVNTLREETPAIARPVLPYFLAVSLLLPNSDWYMMALNHESMHAYQGMRASQRLDAAEITASTGFKRYPYDDSTFKSDWQAELDLLSQAVRAKSDGEASELAGRFLNQRASRRQMAGLSAEMMEFERLKEWEEGIAKYAEISTYRLAATTAGYQPIPEIRQDSQFNGFKGFQQKWDQEVRQIVLESGAGEDGRFYYTGFAQAVLLDRLSPGWKDRLFDDGVWLEDLLAEAIH